jgi:hypothetical protein
MGKKNVVRWITLALALTAGCGLAGQCGTESGNWRGTVERQLRDLSRDINQNSAAWQDLVRDAMDELPEEVRSTIRVELQNLLSRGIAETEVAFQCGVDFLGSRMAEGVEAILARFKGEAPPPRIPRFCSVVPPIVEVQHAATTPLIFYGYNFDAATDLDVRLVDTGGIATSITSKVGRPTHYMLTLSFDPTGVVLGPTADWIELRFGGALRHTVDVAQPTLPPCRTETVPLTNLFVEHVPPLVQGDADFSGNGPTVYAQARLILQPDRIDTEVYMRAMEKRSDWTRAEGKRTYRLYPDLATPSDWRITGITGVQGLLTEEHAYTDGNHLDDSFSGQGLVRGWVFTGDTPGGEAGTETKVKIDFRTLHVQRTETQGCTPTGVTPPLPQSRPLCEWTAQISEEDGAGGVSCRSGYAARGMQCTGSNCDNVSLLCCPYSANVSGTGETFEWSDYVSEEQPGGFFYTDRVLAGVRCRGSRCDDMGGRMLRSPNLGTITNCRNTSFFSEEGFNFALCEMDELITGLRCTGSNCDNVSLRCCDVAGADPR